MIQFRTSNRSDCQDISTIYNHYVGKATMDLSPKSPAYFQSLIEKFSLREKLYVGIVQEKVIAWGIIKKYSDREGYKFASETSIFILPEYRNKGYGKQFKLFLIEQCKKLGYKHLVAKIWSTNKVNVDYNLKLGYTIVGVQQKIGFINGKPIDVVIMQYLIE